MNDYDEDKMACRGGRVLEAWHDMAECVACGRGVRWDLRDDGFFGFEATCENANTFEMQVQLKRRDADA